jgi:hypothetical protein
MDINDKLDELPDDEYGTTTGRYGDTPFEYSLEARYENGAAFVRSLTVDGPIAADRPGDDAATVQKLENVAEYLARRGAILGQGDDPHRRETESRAGPTVFMQNEDPDWDAYLNPGSFEVEAVGEDAQIPVTTGQIDTTLQTLVEAAEDLPYQQIEFSESSYRGDEV